MPSTSLVASSDLAALGLMRFLYVPAGDERPDGVTCVPIEEWIERAKQSQSGFDDVAFWKAQFEALGVGPDAVSVVLDDGRMTEAARVWFILQYFGLPVVVLNGGLPTLTSVPTQAAPAPGPLHVEPGAGRVGLRSRDDLKDGLSDFQVLDARTAAEFRGKDLKGNARGGHLPGAANLSHDRLLDGTHLRPAEEIGLLLDDAGMDPSKPLVAHCNAGGRAALAALAAVTTGRDDVEVYYLSFADWAADESCPIQQT